MSRKYKILNLILFGVVSFAAVMNFEIWSHSNGAAKFAAHTPQADPEYQSQPITPAAKEEPKSFQPYSLISENNIFSPERKEFSSPSLALAEAPKTSIRPLVVLSGIAISDDYQSASVSTPGRLLKRGERETMTLKPGDKIGEYKLTRIETDRIMLEASGDSFEVLLYDRRIPKTRVAMRTEGPPVNETGINDSAPTAESSTSEVFEKQAESVQKRPMTHASLSSGKEDFTTSRSKRSEAIRRALMASDQSNTGIVQNSMKNRAKLPASRNQAPL